jgi:hypothetical protein
MKFISALIVVAVGSSSVAEAQRRTTPARRLVDVQREGQAPCSAWKLRSTSHRAIRVRMTVSWTSTSNGGSTRGDDPITRTVRDTNHPIQLDCANEHYGPPVSSRTIRSYSINSADYVN